MCVCVCVCVCECECACAAAHVGPRETRGLKLLRNLPPYTCGRYRCVREIDRERVSVCVCVSVCMSAGQLDFPLHAHGRYWCACVRLCVCVSERAAAHVAFERRAALKTCVSCLPPVGTRALLVYVCACVRVRVCACVHVSAATHVGPRETCGISTHKCVWCLHTKMCVIYTHTTVCVYTHTKMYIQYIHTKMCVESTRKCVCDIYTQICVCVCVCVCVFVLALERLETSAHTSWSKETPPPGGVSYLLCSSSRTVCKRTPLEGFVPGSSRLCDMTCGVTHMCLWVTWLVEVRISMCDKTCVSHVTHFQSQLA